MPRMIFVILLLIAAAGSTAQAAPCTVAGPACLEKVPFGGSGHFSLVYRSFPLNETNPKIERALIIVHGAGRNADGYFASGVAAALVANALENTIVLSPRFASNSGQGCRDELAPGEISWTCGGDDDWRGGGAASGMKDVFAFGLIDEMIRLLARRDVFPNLRTVVLSGHSAGGQFANRYSALARADQFGDVKVKYAVLNPSSYMYLDPTRLAPGATCSEKGGCTGEFREYREGHNCTTYDDWRYGLKKRTGYNAALPDSDLIQQLAARDVTYLVGEFDTLPVYGFDGSCPAMAQGPTRQARGINFWNYMRSKYKAQHKLVIVPACGHNGRCMYAADIALPALFPK